MILSKGVKVLEIAVGAAFCPDQVLLTKNFPFETWLQTEILTKEFWGWGWGSKSNPHHLSGSEKGVFWKRRLVRNIHFLEILEILENSQTVENKL